MIEYKNEALADFFKDTISFLNSEESYGENKYIIFGVNDEGNPIGLNKDMRDDNEYQNLLNKIKPRPEITSGQLEFEEIKIGFIFIPGKENKNSHRIYEMNEDYCSSPKKHLGKGQSFIRKGSVNAPMMNEDRNKIYFKMILNGEVKDSGLTQKINAKKQLDKMNYEKKDKEGIVEFECENNNNLFSIINGEYTFF